MPTLPGKLVQPAAAVTVQTPFAQAWINAVVAMWAAPDPAPALARYLNPSILAVEVDNPPFDQRAAAQKAELYGLAWQPGDPLPQILPFIVQPGTAPIPPPIVIPPAGGGKRRFIGRRPIWDQIPIPAPQPVITPPVIKQLPSQKKSGTPESKPLVGTPPPPEHIFGTKPPTPSPAKTPRKHGISIAEHHLLLMIEALIDEDDDDE